MPLTIAEIKKLAKNQRTPAQITRLRKYNQNQANRNRNQPSAFESYVNQVLKLQDRLGGGASSLPDGLMEALMSGAMGGNGAFAMPDFSQILGSMGGISVSGGGGGGGFSFPSGYPESVANAQFGVAIESLKRQIEETRAQTASNRVEIGNWYQRPIDKQAQFLTENMAAADAAAEDVQDVTEATMAAGGAEANPALAASLGAFGLLSQGAIEGIGQAQEGFDRSMQTALESQRNDAILIEDRIGGKLVGDLQSELANTERQKASTAAQIAGEQAIRAAELNFQAGQAAADRSLQAGIANANIQQGAAQMAFQAAMRNMELNLTREDNSFNKQMALAQFLQSTGQGGLNPMDVISAAGQIFNIDTGAAMLPYQLQAAGVDIKSALAGIASTEADTAATLAGIPIAEQGAVIAAGAAADQHQLTQANIAQILNSIKQSNMTPPAIVPWNEVSPGDRLNLRNTLMGNFLTDKGKLTQHPLTVWTGIGQIMRSLSNGQWEVKKPGVGGFRSQIMRQIFRGGILTWNRTRWKLDKSGKPVLHARLNKNNKWVIVKKK